MLLRTATLDEHTHTHPCQLSWAGLERRMRRRKKPKGSLMGSAGTREPSYWKNHVVSDQGNKEEKDQPSMPWPHPCLGSRTSEAAEAAAAPTRGKACLADSPLLPRRRGSFFSHDPGRSNVSPSFFRSIQAQPSPKKPVPIVIQPRRGPKSFIGLRLHVHPSCGLRLRLDDEPLLLFLFLCNPQYT